MMDSDNLPLIDSIVGKSRSKIYVDTVKQDIKKLEGDVGDPAFKYIPREANKMAHHIAQVPNFISIYTSYS